MINAGADIHERGYDERSLLQLACYSGKKDAVKMLFDKGADINEKDKYGNTPLKIASDKGFKDIVNLIRTKEAQNSKNKKVSSGQPEEKDGIDEIIIRNKLRPLGNKKRLTHTTEEDDYDARLLLFNNKETAEKYYNLFIDYAKEHRPPFLIEILLLFIPKSIYTEKYAVVIPNEEADLRPGYKEWLKNSILSCNDTLRFHQTTDHKYKELHKYVTALFRWNILIPNDFKNSEEGKSLLFDDPYNCYPAFSQNE